MEIFAHCVVFLKIVLFQPKFISTKKSKLCFSKYLNFPAKSSQEILML